MKDCYFCFLAGVLIGLLFMSVLIIPIVNECNENITVKHIVEFKNESVNTTPTEIPIKKDTVENKIYDN